VRDAAIVALLACACVYPAGDPEGLELSWVFREVNDRDGEEGRHVRTCAGAEVESVTLDITDSDTPGRAGTFRFACLRGFQDPVAFQTESSGAFIPLDPGDYDIELALDFADGRREPLEPTTIAIDKRRVTSQPWEFSRRTVDWTLDLRGLDACQNLRLSLLYADPAAQLADAVPSEDDDTVPPQPYRAALESDRGLPLAGDEVSCSSELAGVHTIADVDPGAYLLEVAADGVDCGIQLDLGPGASASAIDVGALPCDG
jgi:hypothetical protein